jgi:hypothetical protein
MNRRPLLLVVAALAFTASTARADDATPVAAAEPAALAAALPTELMGIPCRASDGMGSDAKITICMGRNPFVDGIAGVTVVKEVQGTYAELVAQMRGSFHESGGMQVVSEEPFAPATAPDAIGLRAEYQTGAGRKLTWSVSHDGVFTRVLVTLFDDRTRETVEPEILAKVFGPDRYPANAAANPVTTAQSQGTIQ